MKFYTWKHRGIVFLVTLSSLAVCVGGGYLLDVATGRYPIYSIVGFFVSFLLTQVALFFFIRRYIKQLGKHV